MPEPGGERQDSREWTLYVCPECGVVDPARDGHYHDDRWVDSKLVRVVEASSVPEGEWPQAIYVCGACGQVREKPFVHFVCAREGDCFYRPASDCERRDSVLIRVVPVGGAPREKVAEALFHAESQEDTPWVDEPGWSQEVYRKHADVVIAAMWEGNDG